MAVEPVGPHDGAELSAYLARSLRPLRPARYWLPLFRPERAGGGPLGFKLTDDAGAVIGFIGTVRSVIPRSSGASTRLVNLSAFVVDEAYRALAPLLLKRALRHEAGEVITDLTASEEVLEILRRLKFEPFGAGCYVTTTLAHIGFVGLTGTVRREVDFGAAHLRLFPEAAVPASLERLSFETLCVGDRALVAWAPRVKFGMRLAEILYVRRQPGTNDDLIRPIATHLLARRGMLLLCYDPAIHGLPTGPFACRHPRRTQPLVLGKASQSAWFYLCSELAILNDGQKRSP